MTDTTIFGRRRAAVLAGLLALAAVCAVAWPLATYTLTLAAFGLPHVLSELRFVAVRFGPRLANDLRRALVGLVVLVALGRLARRFDVVDTFTADIVELLLGIALVVVVVPTLARAGRSRVLLATSIGVLLALGISFSPIHALLAIAVLHNLTPVGFLAEALTGGARRRALAIAAVVFAGIPVVILSGLPFAALHSAGLAAPELAVLPAGPLAVHMRAYLPDDLLSATWALHAFSACVFLQCAHYLAVIDVLPRLVTAPVPRFGLLVVSAAGAFVLFALDFSQARQGYGVLAAVHAWIEVPLLLLATVGAAAYTPKTR